MTEIQINTPTEGFINITKKLNDIISASNIENGLCQIFVPHTTAGLTINENSDPDVVKDMLEGLNALVPKLRYKHGEGNSPAHIKASLVGCCLSVPVLHGRLKLGTWQGIYFCEFDGPRSRLVWITVMK